MAERSLALTAGLCVDAAINLDVAHNAQDLARAVRPHGTIVVYGTKGPQASFPAIDMIVKSLSVRFFIEYDLQADVRKEAIASLTALLENGQPRTRTHKVFSLEEVSKAHQLLESGEAVGNVVLSIP